MSRLSPQGPYLEPPKTPADAIASRATPCFGMCVLIDTRNVKALNEMESFDPTVRALFRTVRDDVLRIVAPNRVATELYQSGQYIAQHFFHGSVAGPRPKLLDPSNQAMLYEGERVFVSDDELTNIATRLQRYLGDTKMTLIPSEFELMPDGSVIFRLKCSTTTDEPAPALHLANIVDPTNRFPKWDAANVMRNTTIAVTIAVINLALLSAEQLTGMRALIAATNESLSVRFPKSLQVNGFWVLSLYDQRTLSPFNVKMHSHVSAEGIRYTPLPPVLTFAETEESTTFFERKVMFTQEFIESFLKGYSAEEVDAIKQDLAIITRLSFYQIQQQSLSERPMYVATAGGPGSAKSTTLETFLRLNNLMRQFVYADPDAVSLKNMIFTYRQSLSYFDFASAPSNHATLKAAYDKWRGASNYITHEILQTAFGGEHGADAKYSIAHGITSTYPKIATLYERIKARGYRITLLLCYSDDETRRNRIERREKEQGFVQCDPHDVVEKGKMFPERFDDYFQHADELFFYWNNSLTHGQLPRPCAKFERTERDVNLTILDERAWICFCRKYLHDVNTLQIPICRAFENLIPRELVASSTGVASAIQAHGVWSNGTVAQLQQLGNEPKQVLSA